MAGQESMTKVTLSRPVQIGAVVKDVKQVAEHLWLMFGIGPFQFADMPPNRPGVMTYYRGKPVLFRLHQAYSNLGNIEFELVELVEGESGYSEFVKERNTGLHHLLFEVPDIDAALGIFAGINIGVSMSGTSQRPGAMWYHLDTMGLLGWSIELRQEVPGYAGLTVKAGNSSTSQYSDRAPRQSQLSVGQPSRIGVVVRNVRRTAGLLQSMFGIGPFEFVDILADDGKMINSNSGRTAVFHLRQAYTHLGNIEIELIEPLESGNGYSEYLTSKGEGFYHFSFEVPDIDTAASACAEMGISVKMKGLNRSATKRWLLLDTANTIGWTLGFIETAR